MIEETLKGIENQLERIAIAVEGLAGAPTTPGTALVCAAQATTKAVEVVTPQVTASMLACTKNWAREPVRGATKDYSEEERAQIKAALEAKGVEYNNRSGSHTLHQMFVEASGTAAEPTPAPQPVEPAPPVAEVTHSDAVALLKGYVQKNGRDAGMALLTELGSTNISGLTPEARIKLKEKCNA